MNRSSAPTSPRLALPLVAVALPAVLSLTACGGTEKHESLDDATGDTVVATDTSGTAADSQASGDGQVSGDTAQTPPLVLCKTDTDCKAQQTCASGVCVQQPAADQVAVLTDPFKDYTKTAEPLSLDCVDKPVSDLVKGLQGPQTVTMWGRVDRFGGGYVTVGVEVAVFKLADFHPEACWGLPADDLEACFATDKVGTPLVKTVSVDPDKAVELGLDLEGTKKPDEVCEKHFDCQPGYECRKESAAVNKICVRTHGIYAVEGVPTNTPLVVRVRGTKKADKWHDSYLWDYVLLSDRTDPKGGKTQPKKYVGQDTFRVNPTIVGEGQWGQTPKTMNLDEIADGNGVIGGRIRDCGVAGGRGGWAIHNAKVALAKPAAGMGFFNDKEDDTVPVKTRSATDELGRFSAVDIPSGPNRIGATARVGDKIVSLGAMDVPVIPGALMIVSLPGRAAVLTK